MPTIPYRRFRFRPSESVPEKGSSFCFWPKVKVIKFDESIIEKLKFAQVTANKILGPTGQYIRKTAQEMVKPNSEPSKPGEPPHTQTHLLPNSILWARNPNKLSVIVGPAYTRFSNAMATHEFGLHRFGRSYPKRPLMGPALRRASRFLPNIWRKYL